MSDLGPLAGVRVIDLTQYVAGPYCTKLLGLYGAEVVKVERPQGGDPMRLVGPFVGDPDPDRGLAFLDLNVNKLGVTLDLHSQAGRKSFLSLVESADVLVESFRPGTIDRLGIGWPVLKSANPNLVLTSISNFGQTGRYRDLPASEIVLYAMGHEMFGTGLAGREPLSMAPRLNLYFAGQTAAVATLGALLGERGEWIDVSIMETFLSSIDRRADSLVAYAYCGERMERAAAPYPGSFPPVYSWCLDGYVAVNASAGPARVTLYGLLGLSDDTDLESATKTWAAWCGARSRREVTDQLQRAGIPCEPVNSMADLVADEHLLTRGFFVPLTHPVAGKASYAGLPVRAETTPGALTRPAPRLGEHNELVFAGPISPRSRPESKTGDTAPLQGIRVLDLGVVLAGPQGAMMLADLGAEVIRVESTRYFAPQTRGSIARPSRVWVQRIPPISGGYPDREPGPRPWNRFPWFNASNRNKLSMTVDLRLTSGQALFERLVRSCDVLVTNQTAGVLEDLQINYGRLRELNPGLVYVEGSSFGRSGPYAHHRGFGTQIEAFAGHDLLRHYPDSDASTNTWAVTADAAGGLAIAMAAELGLMARKRTGAGQHLEISFVENFLGLIGNVVLDQTYNRRTQPSLGNRDYECVQGCYPVAGKDRWIVLTVPDDRAWAGRCAVIGAPQWAGLTPSKRMKRHDEVDRAIAAWSKAHERDSAVDHLRRVGVLAGPVLDDADAYTDPHLQERSYFLTMSHAEAGTHAYPGFPYRLASGTQCVRHPAPLLGEHNEYVYRELLGYSGAEYQALAAEGHIGMDYADFIK
jgi:crotonobetainyl-CoA:carnitine CoA-transferase CaiB-like acyl-CoA transferase